MSVLVVMSPGQTDRIVELDRKAVVLGRGESSDIRVEDPKVSGRHLKVLRLESGGWIVADLGSTRGTRVGRKKVLRAVLEEGSRIHAGATTLAFFAEAPELPLPDDAEAAEAPKPKPAASGPLVGGTLALKAVSSETPKAPRGAPKEAPKAPPVAPPRPPADEPPTVVTRPIEAKSMGRAFVLVAAGLLLIAGVQFFLGPEADEARGRAKEKEDLSEALQRSDISIETFELEVQDYLLDHPDAEHEERLLEYLAAVRAVEAERARLESLLNQLAGGVTELPESEVRGRLLELQRTLPHDADIARQAGFALQTLDRRHKDSEAAALEAIIRAADARIAARDPAGALRRLSAYRYAWPTPSAESIGRVQRVEKRAVDAANALAEQAMAAADLLLDPAARRQVLGAAWRGLAGTPQGRRVAEALRFTRGPGRVGTPGATPSTPGATPSSTPAEPKIDDSILARATEAERMTHERRWVESLVAFKALIDEADAGPLQEEWLLRSREVRQILELVDVLGARALEEAPLKVKLPTGRVEVFGADAEGVDLARGGDRHRMAWADVSTEDVLPLLTPRRPTPVQRLGLGVLAASVSDRQGVVEALLPLLEKGDELAEANRLVARYLFGRGEAPAEGYRVYRGEILDKAGHERRLRDERVAELREKARGVLAQVLKAPALKKLAKLKTRREEIDKLRYDALRAIFNETHYPYPANKQSQQYRAVQTEIDRRVALVKEIWDDTYKVTISRKGPLGRALDKWDEIVAELKRLDVDTTELEAEIEPYAVYVTGEPITIRTFAKNPQEAKLFAYNRWVMETYNPGQDREATTAERQQTRVTNDYRIMLAYTALVKPGPAPYDAIDDENVRKILDEGRIVSRRDGRSSWLLAVRIDDRLVRSARAHSLDMQRRGFFNHFAPPNAATGEPRTSPFDRMQKAGYKGGGASENIANGASSPEQAHTMWIHSSGHHRNILSSWSDQGVGQAGRLWTQNFGVGGGGPAVIEKEAAPGDARDDSDRDGAGSRGPRGR